MSVVSFAVLAVVVMRFGKVGCRAQRRCARSLLPQPTFGTRQQLADVAVVAPGQPPVLQVVHRAITRFLLDQADLKAEQADGGAVTLIQPSLWMQGSAANLNIYLHRLVLDGVYRRTGVEPVFVEVPAPTDEALQALLHKIIGRLDAVADPAQFAQAAAQLQQDSAAVAAPGTMPPTPPTVPDQTRDAPADAADLLAQLLGGMPAGLTARAPAAAAATGIDAFIRSVGAPQTVPNIAPQQATYLASVDVAMAQALRAVPHAPAFQALKSAWRGVQWLISSLELDEDLQRHLFDVSRDELLAEVVAARGQIDQAGLHAALVDRWRNQPGAPGWSALVGLYCIGPPQADIGLLAALSRLASEVGGTFLAAGSLDLAGGGTAAAGADLPSAGQAPALDRPCCARPTEQAAKAAWAVTPFEAFKFDELPTTPNPEPLLWGNGALACALLIGRAFSAKGWGFEAGDPREITDLPAYTVLRGGERELQAHAAHYLGEQGGQALLAAGLMPMLSPRHANAVTVMWFQSVALPAATLAGLSVSR